MTLTILIALISAFREAQADESVMISLLSLFTGVRRRLILRSSAPCRSAPCRGVSRASVVDRNICHFMWYGGGAGDGLRSGGEEALPSSKSVCSILPIAHHWRAGVTRTWTSHPARRSGAEYPTLWTFPFWITRPYRGGPMRTFTAPRTSPLRSSKKFIDPEGEGGTKV